MNKKNPFIPKSSSVTIRSHKKFFEEIIDIQMKRINLGKETLRMPLRTARLTLAITRHPSFKKMKDDLINGSIQ